MALLDNYLIRLQQQLDNVDSETFKNDWALQRMAERSLQVMIELVVDIAERIIALKNAGPVASAAQALEKLVDLTVIKSAHPYNEMIRFRNLIVHQYEEIDPNIVYHIATNHLDTFRHFRDEIDKL